MVDFPEWSANLFEPLVLGISFPHLRSYPFQLKSNYKMLSMGREVQKMLRTPHVDKRDILCELLACTQGFYAMSPSVLRKVLFFGRQNQIFHQNTNLHISRKRKRGRRYHEASRGMGRQA